MSTYMNRQPRPFSMNAREATNDGIAFDASCICGTT